MNRRNVLTGLGGLAISGGALFGTGAFTSVSAERTVEVNVITENDTGASEDVSDLIAEEFVDVRVDVGKYNSVYVNDDSTDPRDLEPTGDGNTPAQQVSLIANNDPTIVFGAQSSGLLNNATTSYENLFIVDNREGDTSQDFNVELSLSENGTGSWLDIGGGDTVGGNGTGNSDLEPIAAGTYSDGSSLQKFGATVDTSGVSENTGGADDTDTLTIKIEQDSS